MLISANVRVPSLLCLIRAAAFAALVAALPGRSQELQSTNVVSTNIPARTVAAKGANERVWGEVVPWRTNELNQVEYRTNHVAVEMATGMHFLSGTNYVESVESITSTENGGEATNGQSKAYFGANLNTAGSIQLLTPDNKLLRSHLMCLSYYDSGVGSNVLIGLPQDRIGNIVGSNQVYYTNALSGGGFRADVRYTYRKTGLEQDIVLREQPPSPESFGLNSGTTRLQVWTEFLDPPTPRISQAQEGGDQDLDFGNMQMVGPGKAFFIGEENNPVPVRKTWVTVTNRVMLLEEIEFSAVAARLQTLPPASGNGTNGVGGLGGQARLYPGFPKVLPPQPKLANKGTGSLKLAKLEQQDLGLVLDYETVSSTSGYTFAGDKTYYVSSSVTLSGTTILEGGAVIKFANSSSAKITLSGPLISKTSPYRFGVLTSVDDNSVGEALGSGSPGNTSATYFAGGSSQVNDYKYIRASFAATAITNSVAATVWHSQFVNCGTAVGAGSSAITLRNVLIANATNCVYTTGAVVTEHLTADACTKLCGATPSSANATNCLLTVVPNQPSWNNFSSSTSNSSSSGVYSTAGGGHYYLNGGTYRNAGTTGINATLLNDIKKKTTYAPTVQPSDFTANTTLSITATRDTDTPDKGYHYDPLDHLISGLSVGDGSNPVTLTLASNVAIGVSGSYGLQLLYDGHFAASGGPTNMNRVAWTAAVQEQGAAATSLFKVPPSSDAYPPATPSIDCHFTDMAALGTRALLVDANADSPSYANEIPFQLSMKDSWLRGLYLVSYPNTAYATAIVNLTNNLLERSTVELVASWIAGNSYTAMQVLLHDNLLYHGTFQISYAPDGAQNIWEVYDNAFDNCSLNLSCSYAEFIVGDHNGYVNCGPLMDEDQYVSISSFNYAEGPLGLWYQSSSDFVDHGHTTADQIGFFHYTTSTSQIREGFTPLDIGFHYIAVDGSGNPVDSDSDGTPDFVEDGNGNGWVDGGDTEYMITLTDPNNIGLTGLQVYTPLKR
jgi:hypothetical protein